MSNSRILKIMPVALTAMLAMGGATLAEKKETRVATGLTAGQFVQNCENMGGSIDDSSQGPEGVSCTLPSGTSADCTFGGKDAYCEVTTPRSSLPARTTKSLLGDSTLQALK